MTFVLGTGQLGVRETRKFKKKGKNKSREGRQVGTDHGVAPVTTNLGEEFSIYYLNGCKYRLGIVSK